MDTLNSFLVDIRSLSADEKIALDKRLSAFAFINSHYFSKNVLVGFVVSCTENAEQFLKFAKLPPNCKHADATGWRTDGSFIDQAFYAAFGRE